MYALGGYDGSRRLNSVEYFDVASEKWNESTSMLFRRGLAGATEMDGKTEGCGWVGGGVNGIL